MDNLLLYYKAFNQLHRKSQVILNHNYHALEIVISKWFVQEIFYLEKRLHLSVIPLHGNTEKVKNQSITQEKSKIMYVLSTDQTGLLYKYNDIGNFI